MTISSKYQHSLLGIICCNLLLISQFSWAISVNFTGNLIENPPCEIYNKDSGQPIRISFGEIGSAKVNGDNYREYFELTLHCDMTSNSNLPLELKYVSPNVASYDTRAVSTSITGLGILLYYNGEAAPVNSSIISPIKNIQNDGKLIFPFYAVPIKNSNATLLDGDFKATAEFQIKYY